MAPIVPLPVTRASSHDDAGLLLVKPDDFSISELVSQPLMNVTEINNKKMKVCFWDKMFILCLLCVNNNNTVLPMAQAGKNQSPVTAAISTTPWFCSNISQVL
jgi:hypothetical protein